MPVAAVSMLSAAYRIYPIALNCQACVSLVLLIGNTANYQHTICLPSAGCASYVAAAAAAAQRRHWTMYHWLVTAEGPFTLSQTIEYYVVTRSLAFRHRYS